MRKSCSAKAHAPLQHAAAQIERLLKIEQIGQADMEPVAVFRPEREAQPVRPVDQILVRDDPAGDFAL
jgi:hypothetical protein